MPGHWVKLRWASDPTIHAPAKYKRACAYQAFVPDRLGRLAITLPMDVAGVVSEAEAAIRTLNNAARPALAPLAHLLLRTESIASSRIEGLQLGVRDLARAEGRLETGGRVSSSAAEVLANIDAMELAVEEAVTADPFGLGQIRAIHRRLMGGAPYPHIAGEIRSRQNWIGGNDYNPCGADFVPPPPGDLGPLLTDLCTAINDDLLPPVVQAALVHAQFETIHPFDDGNGRTGRALIHVVLRKRGIAREYMPPISLVLAGAKNRYIGGLTKFREDRVSEWIEYFAAAATGAAHLASAYIEAVQELTAHWRSHLVKSVGQLRADAAAWAVIDVLPAHPVITARIATEATGRSKPQIYQAMRQLVDAGVLAPLSVSPRNQSWEAVGLLDLMAHLEAGDPPGASG